jgi:hypothetical protein
VAAILDGCPAPGAYYPKTAVAVRQPGGGYVTSCGEGRRLHTSSSSSLQQAMVYLDSFQAFDSNTAEPGDPELAKQLYGRWGLAAALRRSLPVQGPRVLASCGGPRC